MTPEIQTTVGKLAWHVHHKILCEILTEPIEKRLEYFDQVKSLSETPEQIDTRKRLLKIVEPPLPEALRAWTEASRVWDEASRVWEEASPPLPEALRAWTDAPRVGDEALRVFSNSPELVALHEKQCPNCPWDGETIFPEARK